MLAISKTLYLGEAHRRKKTWQGHNKTGAKYYLTQILRGKKSSWGEITVCGGLLYFVEKYIFDWIQHSNKMKRGPLVREEKKQKFGNT